jgi:hypothetical protein
MHAPRFSDDGLQALAAQVHQQISGLAAEGRIDEAAILMERFLGHVGITLLGHAPRRLSDLFIDGAKPADQRFLWLLVSDLLGASRDLKARFLHELTDLFEAPDVPVHIPLGIITLASPPEMGSALGLLYDRLDRCPDLGMRHAVYQRLGFGMASPYRTHPALRSRRSTSYRNLVDAFETALGTTAVSVHTPISGRIALLTGRLAGRRHSPTRMVTTYALALARHAGLTVHLFETQNIELAADEAWLFRSVDWPAPEPALLADLAAAGITIEEVSLEQDRVAQIGVLLDRIGCFAPSVILSMGATDCVAKGLLGRRLPVIDCFMGGQFALYQRCDALLTPQQIEEVAAEIALGGDPALLEAYVHHQSAIDLEPPPVPMARAALGLPADAPVAVTVGNGLDTAIDEAFLELMSALLQELPALHWLVVGPRVPDGFADLLARENIGRRVLRRLYEPNLPALLAAADLYLNPFGQSGGGYAIVDALSAGIAVVSLAGGDAELMLGSRFTAEDRTAYRRQVDALLSPPQPRAKPGCPQARRDRAVVLHPLEGLFRYDGAGRPVRAVRRCPVHQTGLAQSQRHQNAERAAMVDHSGYHEVEIRAADLRHRDRRSDLGAAALGGDHFGLCQGSGLPRGSWTDRGPLQAGGRGIQAKPSQSHVPGRTDRFAWHRHTNDMVDGSRRHRPEDRTSGRALQSHWRDRLSLWSLGQGLSR